MEVNIRLTVSRNTPITTDGWEFPDDPNYEGSVIPAEMRVPVVFLFKLPVPEGMTYPIALTWARTQLNTLSEKYGAITGRIDEDMLRAQFHDHRKIK